MTLGNQTEGSSRRRLLEGFMWGSSEYGQGIHIQTGSDSGFLELQNNYNYIIIRYI